MTTRKLFRQFAQSKGKEAKEFIKIEYDYDCDTLHTKDNKGNLEVMSICFIEFSFWLINTKKIKDK